MKRTLALILALVLCLGVFAGCSKTPTDDKSTDGQTDTTGSADSTAAGSDGEPADLIHEKYEEPVDVHIVLGYRESENPNTPDSVTPETQTAVTRFKENLNINLIYDWIVNTDQFSSKFGAELAAGNLPDIMLLGPNEFQDLYEQGGLGDLSEAYNAYTNEAIEAVVNPDGELINAGMRDGALYGLPMATYAAQVTSQTYYDMNKLKEVGITSYDQLPTTIAEFEELCDKLMAADVDGNGKTGDPVIPANKYYINSGLADFTPVFDAYKAWGSGWYDDGTGNLVSPVIQNSNKDALTKLNEWYNKGYFAKDFAAQDVWAADAPVVSDIVSGKYAIVFGSWWIPNWPLNDSKKNDPNADWVVGPTLTVDGEKPTAYVPRYPVNNFVCVSKDFEHPEALFKMMNWSIEYGRQVNNPKWQETATEAEMLEKDSYVYTWLPYRIYSPVSLVDNYNFINAKREAGSTELVDGEEPNNEEFWGAWNAYVQTTNGSADPAIWGMYLSRLDPQGGVAKMEELYQTADRVYNEVYVTTPSMITKQGELSKLTSTTFLSMIMGETPISEFDNYVAQWKGMGGDDIGKEVNDWYQSK